MASEFQSGEFISATEITENGDYPVYGGNGLRGYANRYNHEGFYALIGRQGALCGNVNCADGKAYFTEHAVAVQANQCNDTGFLVYLLSRMNLGQYSGQSAQPGLAVSTLKEVETLLPNKHEQYRIGSLLKDLDSLITLHQRKCQYRGLYGYLSWEQRKLGEIFEEYSEKNRADLPPLTIIQGGGTVYRDESNRNLQFDKNSLSNYKAVNPDDFIVHLRSFEGGLEKATCCGLISPAYHTFHGDGIDSDFYYLYFRSKRFIDTDLKPHVYGIRDGRSIDIDGMKTIPIPWTTVNEQRAIGGFYNSLDFLITLHQ